MDKIQAILQRIFKELDDLDDELKPYDAMLRAADGKPLAECGASERIKIAVALLKVHKMEVPYTRKRRSE